MENKENPCGSIFVFFQNQSFFDASYVSIVLLWITTDVSPFCHASLRVVIVRVTLHASNTSVPRTPMILTIKIFLILTSYFIAVFVVLVVQLMHRIA